MPNIINSNMLINEVTKDGAAITPTTGLYDAKVGDIIEIGVEGIRYKQQTKDIS